MTFIFDASAADLDWALRLTATNWPWQLTTAAHGCVRDRPVGHGGQWWGLVRVRPHSEITAEVANTAGKGQRRLDVRLDLGFVHDDAIDGYERWPNGGLSLIPLFGRRSMRSWNMTPLMRTDRVMYPLCRCGYHPRPCHALLSTACEAVLHEHLISDSPTADKLRTATTRAFSCILSNMPSRWPPNESDLAHGRRQHACPAYRPYTPESSQVTPERGEVADRDGDDDDERDAWSDWRAATSGSAYPSRR